MSVSLLVNVIKKHEQVLTFEVKDAIQGNITRTRGQKGFFYISFRTPCCNAPFLRIDDPMKDVNCCSSCKRQWDFRSRALTFSNVEESVRAVEMLLRGAVNDLEAIACSETLFQRLDGLVTELNLAESVGPKRVDWTHENLTLLAKHYSRPLTAGSDHLWN